MNRFLKKKKKKNPLRKEKRKEGVQNVCETYNLKVYVKC